MLRDRPLGDVEANGRPIDNPVGRIGEFDEERVRPRRKSLNDERFAARVDPMPRRAIEGDVQVPDAGRNVEGGRPEKTGTILRFSVR